MVVYYVRWERDKSLSKVSTKGRPKTNDSFFAFTVMCRNSKDAISCLEYLFYRDFQLNTGITIEDGVVSLKRLVLDSRGFTCQWLFMDGIRLPISLSDLNKSVFQLVNSYRI